LLRYGHSYPVERVLLVFSLLGYPFRPGGGSPVLLLAIFTTLAAMVAKSTMSFSRCSPLTFIFLSPYWPVCVPNATSITVARCLAISPLSICAGPDCFLGNLEAVVGVEPFDELPVADVRKNFKPCFHFLNCHNTPD